MAVLDIPAALWVGPGSGWGQTRYDITVRSDASGADQTRLYGPPRWAMSLVQPSLLTPAAARAWMAMVIGLRGRVNHLKAWDAGRPRPLGTFQSNGTLVGAAALGATTCTLAGGAGMAGATLLPGDKVQLGSGVGTSQLIMVVAPATAGGTGQIAITFEPPLRVPFVANTSAVVQRPCAYFRQQGSIATWSYASAQVPNVTGMALDLLESWTP